VVLHPPDWTFGGGRSALASLSSFSSPSLSGGASFGFGFGSGFATHTARSPFGAHVSVRAQSASTRQVVVHRFSTQASLAQSRCSTHACPFCAPGNPPSSRGVAPASAKARVTRLIAVETCTRTS